MWMLLHVSLSHNSCTSLVDQESLLTSCRKHAANCCNLNCSKILYLNVAQKMPIKSWQQPSNFARPHSSKIGGGECFDDIYEKGDKTLIVGVGWFDYTVVKWRLGGGEVEVWVGIACCDNDIMRGGREGAEGWRQVAIKCHLIKDSWGRGASIR